MNHSKNERHPHAPSRGLTAEKTEPLKSDIESLKKQFARHLKFSLAKDEYSATLNDSFKSLAYTVRDRLFEKWIDTQQAYYNHDVKRVYYISMEFMMGRMLGNAMINIDLKDDLDYQWRNCRKWNTTPD